MLDRWIMLLHSEFSKHNKSILQNIYNGEKSYYLNSVKLKIIPVSKDHQTVPSEMNVHPYFVLNNDITSK